MARVPERGEFWPDRKGDGGVVVHGVHPAANGSPDLVIYKARRRPGKRNSVTSQTELTTFLKRFKPPTDIPDDAVVDNHCDECGEFESECYCNDFGSIDEADAK